MGMSGGSDSCMFSYRWRYRYFCVACGGDGANRRHGGDCGVNRRRRFGALVFQGLLSSAIDLVLLG